MAPPNGREAEYEYIVVGSGAGGGTVAARLAEHGHKVILLEAGGDPCKLEGGDPIQSGANRLPHDYQVPVFHAFASENEALKWDFFVRHYSDLTLQRSDPNYRSTHNGKTVDGVLYPRASTLGGCTAHNAMILVYPHDRDWNEIAQLTGDRSWSADNMRPYFQRLESCHHRTIQRWLFRMGMGINPSRHGFAGWLHTEKAIPMLSLRNYKLFEMIADSAAEAIKKIGDEEEQAKWVVKGQLDPNDWRTVRKNAFGVRYLPLTTHKHVRHGSRERVLEVAKEFPDRLTIELNALVTRVLIDENRRAVGVEYLKGENLYRVSGKPSQGTSEKRKLHASREVILAGGAFNTPQLLMLSGIGPRDELKRHGIEVKVDLAGVGANLQDRYEAAVVCRMAEDWAVFRGAKFDSTDPQFREWQSGRGPYITNGSVLALFKRSAETQPLPDLFCMALLGKFSGYYPGYSKAFAQELNYLTWAVLKAHTNNRAGQITLRSADPLDPPDINFRYFQEGTPDHDEDLNAVISGIRFVREITTRLRERKVIAEETSPGEDKTSKKDLQDHVRSSAWGHHACGSCAIGPRHLGGVLTSDFRVHGVHGLRVVDASVFPRIPGFFIASSVYMIAEKAADNIMGGAADAFPLAPVEKGGGRSGLVSKGPEHLLPYGTIFEEHLARRRDCLKKAVIDEMMRRSATADGGAQPEGKPADTPITDTEEALWETTLRDRIGEIVNRYEELEASKVGPDILPARIDELQNECSRLERPLKRVLHRMHPSALCLSGGGIRSASFGLGILEGLARFSAGLMDPNRRVGKDCAPATTEAVKADPCTNTTVGGGLLHNLDYLSTVSGGGYIGSWLSACIYRRQEQAVARELNNLHEAEKELTKRETSGRATRKEIAERKEKVQSAEDELQGARRKKLGRAYHVVLETLAGQGAATSGDPAPRAIRHLREYTSYLSPSLGLSLDSWTLAAIFFRNLFINWLMLAPMLVGVVALPQVAYYVSLSLANWLHCQVDRSWHAVGLAAVLGLFIGAAFFAKENLPSHRVKQPAGPGLAAIVMRFAVPVMLANWILLELWWSISGSIVRTRLLLIGAASLFGISAIGLLLLVFLGVFRTYNSRLRSSAHEYLARGSKKAWRAAYMAGSAIISSLFATALAGLLALSIFPALAQHNHVASARRTGGLFCCDVSAESSVKVSDAGSKEKGHALDFHVDQRLLMTFGLPLMTLVPLLAVSLLSGLLGNFEMEEDREWWSRVAGIQLAAIGVWTLAHGIALYSGDVLDAIWVFGVSGAALGGAGSALGFSGKTAAGPRPVKKEQLGKLGEFLQKYDLVTPAICGVALLLLALFAASAETALARVLCWKVGGYASLFGGALNAHVIILAAAIALAFLVNRAISVNIFSLNGLYRMRLMRAFLGASNIQRQPDTFTGFDPRDTPSLIDLAKADGAPLHVINTTLNLVGTENTAWRQRKAEPFSFTALHCGSWRLGYVPTRYYAGADGPTLATAMTISGAAFNPNMGYHSSPLVTLLMTFFDVRLGWWLPNPAREEGARHWKWSPKGIDFLRRSDPVIALEPLILEAFGMTDDKYRWIELTDGGHFENLGLYEMVLRRCEKIIVVDAGADPKCQFEDLGNAIRKIEIDLGVPIRFGPDLKMRAGVKPNNHYCAVATIDYGCVDDDPSLCPEQREALQGKLIYIKAAITGQEPPDIKQYALTHDDFPHETTANQFFNEAQFESYRHLGSYEIETIVKCGQPGRDKHRDVADTFPKVSGKIEALSSPTTAAGKANEAVPPGTDFDTFFTFATNYAAADS